MSVASTPAGALVREVLDDYGPRAQARLRHYLAAHDDPGSVYALAADYPARGGRAMRSSLCMATARAFGADPLRALNTAVAVELLHNAFLVHDDVEDQSEDRRGQPTLHRLHGLPIAVNVGDALAVASLRPLLDNIDTLGYRVGLRVLAEAERMARESVEGQALELWWREHNVMDLSPDDYLHMVLKKTCWYSTIFPLRAGALIATDDGVNLDETLRFGFFVGAAFQVQDDLLNLVGDVERYGKELNGDIWEGKRTLMLIHLCAEATPAERDRLQQILEGPRVSRSGEDVAWVRERMDHYRSIEFARALAHAFAGAARHEFERAFGALGDSREKRFLEAMTRWVIERA